jgi:hypothetical protein
MLLLAAWLLSWLLLVVLLEALRAGACVHWRKALDVSDTAQSADEPILCFVLFCTG